MEMSASAWKEYEKHYKAGYEKGRADERGEWECAVADRIIKYGEDIYLAFPDVISKLRADMIDEFLKIVNREIALLEDRESTENNEGRWVDEEKCLFAIKRLEHLAEQMKAAYERGKSNSRKKQLEDMQEKTRLIDANAFIRSLDNYEGKPFTPGLCATLVELFPATCDTEAYLKGRTDQKHEDLDAQVILTKHEIKVLETSLIKRILTAIESQYDLDDEYSAHPREFYDLVKGFYPAKDEN